MYALFAKLTIFCVCVCIEITTIKRFLTDIDQIDSLEDGHLNLAEIRLLEVYLDRCQIPWNQAWLSCLHDFNENYYTTGKHKIKRY